MNSLQEEQPPMSALSSQQSDVVDLKIQAQGQNIRDLKAQKYDRVQYVDLY